jgi:flagellar biosynthesis protein FlhB
MSEKTEEATPKRLRKAREEGDSGASAFAAQAVAFLVAVTLVPMAARALVGRVEGDVRAAIASARGGAVDAARAIDAEAIAVEIATLALPVLVAAAIAGSVVSLVQTGGFVATKKLAPKLERLDPIAGLRGLVSAVRLFAVARALVGAAVVAWLAERALAAHVIDLARLGESGAYVAPLAAELAGKVARDAALVGVALGAFDMLVVRRAWMRRLRMSKEEVKREYKESEGDPQIKQARERAHQEMLASAAVANVRSATVVVVNPTHLATALRYDEGQGDAAPVVVATGEGDLAARIVAAARDFRVPVVRDVPLARALAELAIGDAIPEVLYEAVAEILRDAWEAEERSAKGST